MNKQLYNLTSPQNSIWSIEQFYQDTNINTISGSLTIEKEVNFEYLKKAINTFIKYNDALRTRIVLVDNTPKQYIDDFIEENFIIEDLVDLKDLSKAEKAIGITSFNMLHDKLYDFHIYRLQNGFGGFIFRTHHIISDAWSMSLVITQVLSFYDQLEKYEKIEAVSYSYTGFIKSEQIYLNSEKFINDKLYWEEIFTVLPDIPSFKTDSVNKFDSCRKEFILPQDITEKINSFCSKKNISQYIFFLSVFSVYFKNILNSNNYTIGNPILNRSNYREKHTIGTFINTVPFIIDIINNDNFIEHCTKLSANQKAMYRHIKYPFKLIQQNIRKQYPNIFSLFDIVFSYQNAKADISDNEIKFHSNWIPNGQQAESLMIHIKDTDNTGKVFIDYDFLISVFSDEQIGLMHDRILGIIHQVLKQPNILIKDIEIITKKETHELLYDLNDTYMEYDKKLTIIDLFEEQVKINPLNIAVNAGETSLTYEELNNRANILAYKLQESGVCVGDIVGILLNRNENIIVSIFAILKLGATYMPIDPDYPSERVKYMLENSSAKIIISSIYLVEDYEQYPILIIDSLDFSNIDNLHNLNTPIDANSLAYIMYTSGSTGNPKAVCIKHYNVINYVKSMQKRLDYTANSNNKVFSVTTMCFDIFVFEVFPTLLSGLQLVIANEFEAKNPELLSNIIIEKKICKLMTTPSRVQLLFLDNKYLECLTVLKEILLGGEPFPRELLPKLQGLTNAKICNLYGPTETTVYSSYKDLTNVKKITIGNPIENTQIYILNENNKLLPIDSIGEICIGGAGVGAGYYNHPELTETVFIKNPYIKNDIIYRTGDLGKWSSEKELLCFGRKDFQIKIRGYRVELDDIVNNILTYPSIDNAIVIDKEDKEGKQYLCAYIVSKKQIDFSQLQRYLSGKLPNYMLPSHFMQIKEIPLTLNHKINRKALPEPESTSTVPEYIPPATDMQKTFCKVIADTLSLDRIGITNDIFDYQIDSLNIIAIQTKLLQHNIKIGTQTFYKYRTIETLVASIDNQISLDYNINKKLYTINNSFKKFSEFPIEFETNNYKNIFLMGSTGYLGIHILKELLTNTSAKIYCPVRSLNGNSARKRLAELYKSYFNEDLSKESRLKILDSDILVENFGLDIDTYNFLKKKIDLVINSAANVKYYGDVKVSTDINVTLTKILADFCIDNNIKLAYLSTLGVSGNFLVNNKNANNIFTEENFYIGQDYKKNIYIKTKFQAEEIIYNKVKNGLTATIYRIGNLTSRYIDGVFQKNIKDNAFYNILKLILKSKMVPKSLINKTLEFTPVDLCASAICKILLNVNTDYRVFHVFNNNYLLIRSFIDIVNKLKINMEIIDDEDYKDEIIKFPEYSLANVVMSNLKKDTSNLLDNTVVQKNVYTNDILNALNFIWPDIDIDYIKKIINFMKGIDFI